MGDGVRVIAEIKKASPSKGLLSPDFDPTALAETYATNGAAAVSVLTDADYFQGSVQHLAEVRRTLTPHGIPILRKEFIVDPYQVYEARAYDADAIFKVSMAHPSSRAVCWRRALRKVPGLKRSLRSRGLPRTPEPLPALVRFTLHPRHPHHQEFQILRKLKAQKREGC